MKIWNKCICLTSPKSLMVIGTLLISTLVIASVWTDVEPIIETPVEQIEVIDSTAIWVPTEEDIAYQDSMFTIIQKRLYNMEVNSRLFINITINVSVKHCKRTNIYL